MRYLSLHTASTLCYLLVFCTACSDGECPGPKGGNASLAMTLAVEGGQTRARIELAEDIMSLGLFGYSTGTDSFDATNPAHLPNLMHNRLATRSEAGGDWSYSPDAYWPVDLSVKNSFFAYSPHSSLFPVSAAVAVSGIGASGYPTLSYTVPELVSEQVDVLYSEYEYAVGNQKYLNANTANVNRNTNGGQVLYKMKHALTWLAFMAYPEPRSGQHDEYHIVSLRFIVDKLVTRASLNLGTGEWVNPVSSSADYQFDVVSTALPVGQVNAITATDNQLMLIPQNFTVKDNPSTIDIVYTINDADDGTDDSDEYFYTIPFPDTKLGAGRVTVYLLRLSPEGAQVQFLEDNTITQWLEGGALPPLDVY